MATDPLNDFAWYYVVNDPETEEQKSMGPVSLRDMDVLYRTQQINSNTFIFKQGMKQWEPLFKVEEARKLITETNSEQMHLQGNEDQAFIPGLNPNNKLQPESVRKMNAQQKAEELIQQQKNKSEIDPNIKFNEDDQDEDEENEFLDQLENDPEKFLETTVQNLIKSKFYQKENGKWMIFNDENQEWKEQDNEPIEEIKKMEETLMKDLKEKLDENQKNAKKPQKKDLTGLSAEEIKKIEKNRKKSKKQAEKRKQKLRELKANSYIYIQGLPEDIDQDALIEFFGKAGIIKEDIQTNQKKVKIYKDEQGKVKGDATIGYEMEESVQLAIEMLDGRFIDDKHKIKVQRAHFDFKKHKNEENGSLNQKREPPQKLDKIALMKLNQKKQKQQGWEEDDQIVGFRQVIIKNMFTLEEAKQEENFFQYLEEDLIEELQKIGVVQKLKIFENNNEGVVQIKFELPAQAEKCIEIMHNRFFDQKQLICEYWDGVTDYSKPLEVQQQQQQQHQLEKKQGTDNIQS
ncbi:hypothetical protein PPERSA_12115 [Pseudocohnilembus persalinus]|uniref:RRM domain-containing protein n=1 Tax=Pseudocohnilembus persalinus TaxID=266149 RepID=A0A0V0QNR8_PSEPJ|nr:hypothetical protein PPERSA_12115 [Pseudocohnilembus persalinus]|eukprot:KRX03910.1 hypothetical protein PPERSA_12115 [Pseudocohnilembus persalinus]